MLRLKHRRFGRPAAEAYIPTVQSGLLVSWCGMRGLVTLATAFALPQGFPGRDLIVLAAFTVVLGTLVLQGLTLVPLLERLRLAPEDAARARGVARASRS